MVHIQWLEMTQLVIELQMKMQIGRKDPLVRFRKFLENKGLWNEEKMKLLNVLKTTSRKLSKADNTPKQTVIDLMDIMYEDISKLS